LYGYSPAPVDPPPRRFYEEILGFTPKEELAGGIVYQFGGATACFLYPSENAGTSQASQAFWQVDDVEREVAALKDKGVKFEQYDVPGLDRASGIVTGGGARAAWFRDSEGNIMAIVQDLRPADRARLI
jgi:predicted enzyme related to lactoylglutathione lyase